MIIYKVPATDLFKCTKVGWISVYEKNKSYYDTVNDNFVYVDKDSIGKWGDENDILYTDHYFDSLKEAELFMLLQTQKKIKRLTEALNIQNNSLCSIISEIKSEAF